MFNRGKRFEYKVRARLEQICSEFPARVRMRYQPRLEQPHGVAIPDFELTIDLGPTVITVLIECQHRVRSGPDVAYKIRAIKSTSDRNLFLYIHGSAIAPALRNALAADGVQAFSWSDFEGWLDEMRKLVGIAATLPPTPPEDRASPVLHLRHTRIPGNQPAEVPPRPSDSILSVLPSQELGAGEFFPFSCVLQISVAPASDPSQLHIAGMPYLTTARTAHDKEFAWHSADPGASLVRHELTHFFQGITSPVLVETALERRLIYSSVLDFLVDKATRDGVVEYPWSLEVQPKWTAYGAMWRPDPMVGLSAMHLFEALAIYHEFMHPDIAAAQNGLVFAVQALKNARVLDGLYDRILGSFVWDFREDFYALFPLVAWTSLIPFGKHETVNQHRTSTIQQFLHLNEFLFENRPHIQRLVRLAEDRSEAGRIRLWAEWRDILDHDLKLKFVSRVDEIAHWSDLADRMARDTPNVSHRWEILPHLAHMEAAPLSYDELMPILIGLFVDDGYDRLLGRSGWPTIIVGDAATDDALRVGRDFWLDGVDHPKLAGWQRSWHLLDGAMRTVVAEQAKHDCHHTECPLHERALCVTWRPYPGHWDECRFPQAFEKVTSVSPSLFRRLDGSFAGHLTYSIETLELSAT